MKSVDADDQWWDDRIQQNKLFRKFRNKDLIAYWFSHDALFFYVIGEDLNDDIDDFNEEDNKKEGSGDSDEDILQSPHPFASCSMKSLKSSGSKKKNLKQKLLGKALTF